MWARGRHLRSLLLSSTLQSRSAPFRCCSLLASAHCLPFAAPPPPLPLSRAPLPPLSPLETDRRRPPQSAPRSSPSMSSSVADVQAYVSRVIAGLSGSAVAAGVEAAARAGVVVSSAPPVLRRLAKKMRERRVRAYMAISKAEKRPIEQLFSEQPTKQIYLANGGASCGVKHEECRALLEQFGAVHRVILIGLSPFAVAEFESVEGSMAAKAALDSWEWQRPEAESRQLFVEYAQVDQSNFLNEEQHPLQLPNARPLEQISPVSVCTLEQLPQLLQSQTPMCTDPSVLDTGVVPGLLLVHDFISEEEEKTLLQYVNSQPWEEIRLRRVQHYGYSFNYRVNNVDRSERKGEAIPADFDFLLQRMKQLGVLDTQQRKRLPQEEAAASESASSSSSPSSPPAPLQYLPDQLTVNRYEAGHGIPAHVDTHSAFTDVLVSLSLQSSLVMEFAPTSSAQFLLNFPPTPIHAPLPARSLLVLTGAARYGYTHAIRARRTDRVCNVLTHRAQRTSLTFRQLRHIHTDARKPRCECDFPSDCDTRLEEEEGISKRIISQRGANNANKQTEAATAVTPASSSSTMAAAAIRPAVSPASPARAFSTAASPASSSSSSNSSSSSASPSSSSPPSPSFLSTLPPPPLPLSPEIEACHMSACLAGQSTYKDPATGYTVFTVLGLMRNRKGVCCGNACRHCPYQHERVPEHKKKNNKDNK